MIAAMQKAVLLFPASAREEVLHKLQKLGLLQAVTDEELTCAEMDETEAQYEKCRRILEDLKPFVHASLEPSGETAGPAALVERLEIVRKEIVISTREINRLNIEKTKLAPWGEFQRLHIKKLEETGVHTAFFEIIEEEYDKLLEQDLCIETVSQGGGMIYFLLFYQGERPRIDAHELRPGELSLHEIDLKLSQEQKKKEALTDEFQKGANYTKQIKEYMITQLDRYEYLRTSLATGALGSDAPLCRLNGWFTKESQKELTRHLDQMNLWYHFEDPQEKDMPPILLKNPGLITPFETITKVFSLPDYKEIDPTPFFAPFFALFFGLCVADLGYGIIVLLASLSFYFFGPRRFKKFFALGSILGALTIAGGVFLNTFFGASLFSFSGDAPGLLESGKKIAFLGSYSQEGRVVFPSISFALFLGFIQVALGIALQGANALKRGLIYALLPLSFLGMMFSITLLAAEFNILEFASFTIAGLPIGQSLAQIGSPAGELLLGLSLTLLFFFNNPDKKLWMRPLTALWSLYNFAQRLLGDILSYLRLFALGLAGGLLGNAFNNIAFLFVTKENGITEYTPAGVVAMVLILIAGHTLNFGLALLGGFVHSLRLTFVEFYSNMNFQGGGKIFTPFAYTTKKEG